MSSAELWDTVDAYFLEKTKKDGCPSYGSVEERLQVAQALLRTPKYTDIETTFVRSQPLTSCVPVDGCCWFCCIASFPRRISRKRKT